MDLFKLFLRIYPGDIPGSRSFGFNFNMTGVIKANLADEVRLRAQNLVEKVKDCFKSGVSIELASIELIDETKAKMSVTVNRIQSEDLEINLYKED